MSRRTPSPSLNPPDEGRDPTEAEEIAACLNDDAARVRELNENPECEIASNMEQAAHKLTLLEQRAAIGDAFLRHIVGAKSYVEFREKFICGGDEGPYQNWHFDLYLPAPALESNGRLQDSTFNFEQALSLFIFEYTGLPKEVIDSAINEAQPGANHDH